MASITEIQSGDLITNSRTDINNNFTNLNTDKIETSVLDTDTTLAANSDAKIPSQKAVKAYVDTGGNVNATETTKGIVEVATTAEFNAGTDTGATGAPLIVLPSQVVGLARSYKIATASSSSDVSGTTAEVTLISGSIPANKLSTNNAVKIKFYITDFGIQSGTAIFRLKYGATTLATFTLDDGAGDVNDVQGFVEALLLGAGTTSSQRGTLLVNLFETKLVGGVALGTSYFFASATGTSAEDSTTTLTISLTVEFTNSDPGNDCVVAGGIIELVT